MLLDAIFSPRILFFCFTQEGRGWGKTKKPISFLVLTIFPGHVIWKNGLENLALTGRIKGWRSRGRMRILWMSSLRSGISESGIEISGRMNYFIEYGTESCRIPWSPTSQDMARKEEEEEYSIQLYGLSFPKCLVMNLHMYLLRICVCPSLEFTLYA